VALLRCQLVQYRSSIRRLRWSRAILSFELDAPSLRCEGAAVEYCSGPMESLFACSQPREDS